MVAAAQEVCAGLDASLAAAKTGRTVSQSQKRNTPGLRRLHHTMEPETVWEGAITAVAEVCPLLRAGLTEARGRRSPPRAVGPTLPLLDSQQQRPPPVGGGPAAAARRGSLLLLSALSSTSRPAGGHLDDAQRLHQLLTEETRPVRWVGSKVAEVRPGTHQARGCSGSTQRHSCRHPQRRARAGRSHGIATAHQAASPRDSA